MANENLARRQDIRSFTVRIMDADHQNIFGTGVIVSAGGGIVTCAHVVEAALGFHPRDAGDAEVGIYIPKFAPNKRRQTARIARAFPMADDDAVLLQITDSILFRPDQVAVLGRAGPSDGNGFESYGYRRLDNVIGNWTYGTIGRSVEVEDADKYLVEPVQIQSSQIDAGMSGAGVLDKQRNLVVGLISDTWFPDNSPKDRDTAWAVDGAVLAFDPLALPLREEPVPFQPAPVPRAGKAAELEAVAKDAGVRWNTAPPSLEQWVGRTEMLLEISRDWSDPTIGVTGLIGFGGEGKSSLARKWVDDLLAVPDLPAPDGVFWWGFYEKKNAEEFFSVLLEFMSQGEIDATTITSVTTKAQIVGAMLGNGRYIFVLDGLEVMQFRDGDRYGEVQSQPLAEFITFIANPANQSFALVTSRVQLLDLTSYDTYRERPVARLSTGDGVDLLKSFGCYGPEASFTKLVENWDGHALTLNLLGSFLADRYGGDIGQAATISPPVAREHRYHRVRRVLQRYDEHFSDAERAILSLIAVCRAPMPTLFVILPSTEEEIPEVLKPLVPLDADGLIEVINRLLGLRILRQDKEGQYLTAHPLIRSYYQAKMADNVQDLQAVHTVIMINYMDFIEFDVDDLEKEPEIPSLADLPPLEDILPQVETVYHACQAGRYDIGLIIHHYVINRQQWGYLSVRYGAHETEFDLCLNFFPDGDINREPYVMNYQNKMASVLLNLGRTMEAIKLTLSHIEYRIEEKNWLGASRNYGVLADAYMILGNLEEAEAATRKSLDYLGRTEQQGVDIKDALMDRWQAQADLAWILSQRGRYEEARTLFHLAEENAVNIGMPTLLGLSAVYATEHLIRSGQFPDAEDLEAQKRGLEAIGRRSDLLKFQLLEAIVAAQLEPTSALEEFNLALQQAQDWGGRHDIVSAKVARGTFAAKSGDRELAFQDLESALVSAEDDNFKLQEIEANIGLGWAYLAEDDLQMAQDFAQKAMRDSKELGYDWGMVDGRDLLEVIEGRMA